MTDHSRKRPRIAPFEPEGIIPDMQAYAQWVTWILEYDSQRGQWTKRPYNARTGSYASVDNPDTWSTYQEAFDAYKMSYTHAWDRPAYSGLGFVLTAEDPFFGIDIDKCVNTKTGEIAPAAQAWVNGLQSYTQWSPGGAGLRIFGYGKLPGTDRRKGTMECYDSGRYLTMTGRLFPGAPFVLASCQEALDRLHAEYIERKPVGRPAKYSIAGGNVFQETSPELTDDQVLALCRRANNREKFTRLYDQGDTSGHNGDHSIADMALVTMIAFYTQNADQIKRLFESSSLCRGKWTDRGDYWLRTIERALSNPQAKRWKPGHGPTPLPSDIEAPGGPKKECCKPDFPEIEVNGRDSVDIAKDAYAAILKGNSPAWCFVRSGRMVRIKEDEHCHATIEDVTTPILCHHLIRCARFYSTSEKRGRMPVNPALRVLEDILAYPKWPEIPPLESVTTVPALGRDGALISKQGYNAASRLYYHPPTKIKVGDTKPTAENVTAAKELLLNDLLGDFPFVDNSSRAHALALLFLFFTRHYIQEPTPLHAIDAPKAGTGKGLLAQALISIISPRGISMAAPPTEEPEWQKMLLSHLMSGSSYLLLDNARKLDSQSFLAALTGNVFKGRVLGTNYHIELPIQTIWVTTCNNLAGNDELVRRILWIRLDAGVEQPDSRTEFRHPDLLSWVREKRNELITAIFVLLRLWLNSGMPTHYGNAPSMGSFERWAKTIGGILSCAGIEGFLQNRELLRQRMDRETQAWHGFVQAWFERFDKRKVAAGDLLELALEYLPDRVDAASERGQKSRLGRLLIAQTDRVYADYKIRSAGIGTSGTTRCVSQYYLEPLKNDLRGDLFASTEDSDLSDFSDLPYGAEKEYKETQKLFNENHLSITGNEVPITAKSLPKSDKSEFLDHSSDREDFEL